MMDRPDRGPIDSDVPSDTAGSSESTPSGAKSKKSTTKAAKKKTAGKKAEGKASKKTPAGKAAGKKAAGKATAKTAGKRSAGKTSKKPPGRGPTDDEIRQRAYEIHRERGGGHGMDEDDWHRAERELRARKAPGKPEE